MEPLYINPSLEDKTRLNDIMYFHYVTEDGINFKWPNQPGTTSYLNVDEISPLDQYLINATTNEAISQEDRNFISNLLTNTKNYDDAVVAGWIVVPNLG